MYEYEYSVTEEMATGPGHGHGHGLDKQKPLLTVTTCDSRLSVASEGLTEEGMFGEQRMWPVVDERRGNIQRHPRPKILLRMGLVHAPV